MPHQCTTCDRAFPDGSKAMLGGCPDCGGNKFQFLPSDAAAGAGSAAVDVAADRSGPSPAATSSSASGRDGHSSTTDGQARADDDVFEAPSEPRPGDDPGDTHEDVAQASARRSVVSRDELPVVDDRDAVFEEIERDSRQSEPAARRERADHDQRPDLDTLRRELNDQFESIKIVEPGEYELNLMELYDREEYIIALKEDGRYVIDVPARWTEDPGE